MSDTAFTVYGFLDDVYLHKTKNIGTVTSEDQGVGCIDSILKDYFGVPSVIRDTRSYRSQILTSYAQGAMTFWYDTGKLEYDAAMLQLQDSDRHRLFNIIEIGELSQNVDDAHIGTQLEQDQLTAGIYKSGSFMRSTTYQSCTVKQTVDTTIKLPQWMRFEVQYTGKDTRQYTVVFKIYLSRTSFLENYELTTISRVVPVCDPAYLFKSVTYKTDLESVISSALFSGEVLDNAILTGDHQGYYLYQTKYTPSADQVYHMPFGILYKGAKRPSTVECRAAIKQYLIDLQMAATSTIKGLFPELFIEIQYYIVPLWDKYIARPDRIIYPSISPKMQEMVRIMGLLYGDDTEQFMQNEIIVNAQNDMYSIIRPHPMNDEKITVAELFPTYLAHSAQEPAYAYMDAADKVFAQHLMKCYAVLNGTILSNDFIETTVDGLKYLSFSASRAEFHVLTKDSYLGRV